jgi:hypothetical protein
LRAFRCSLARSAKGSGVGCEAFGERGRLEVPMDERRKIQRHRTLKAGSIRFNRASGIDCRIRNLSPAGACLEVASQLGIPDEFTLVVEHDHLRQKCYVIWRTSTRLGVEFRAA